MALQGSLDGFPLPDVLALLASTKKRGELRVSGHQGSGRVWMTDGAVVAAESGSARAPVDVLFQLLRVDTGSFSFDPHADVPEGRALELELLLAEAQARLAEWQLISEVVPSLATLVELAEELPSSKATVTAAQWQVLRAVAGGGTVQDVAKVLDVDEFHACQAVKQLVDAGLVTVGEGMSESADDGDEDNVEQEEEVVDVDAAAEDDAEVDADDESSETDELVTIPDHLRAPRRRPQPEPEARPRLSPLAIAAARRRAELGELNEHNESGDLVGAAAAALTPENANALVRELSALGTDVREASEVIKAASHAPSTEERAAALEGVLANDEGEPLNRALLVKFLSSVRS